MLLSSVGVCGIVLFVEYVCGLILEEEAMAKLVLRISVILMLVLGAAALGLGVILFQQRHALKGRTQTLEDCVKRIANTIETGGETGSTIFSKGPTDETDIFLVP